MTLKRKRILTKVVRARVKPDTYRALVRCAKAFGSNTVSEFLRVMLEENMSGDVQRTAEFARKLAGGLGHQLLLDLAQNGGKGRK